MMQKDGYRAPEEIANGLLASHRDWRKVLTPRSGFVLRKLLSPEKRTTIEVRNPTLPLFFLFCLVVYIFTLGEVPVLILGIIGFLLLSAYLWSKSMADGVHARRELLSAAIQVGDEVEERIELENDSMLPLIWAEFVDQSTLPGYSIDVGAALDVLNRRQWSNRVTCQLRGIYRMGPWELHMGDPFGVFRVRQRYTDQREMVVYPPLAEIPADLLPQSSSFGDAYFYRAHMQADSTKAYTTRPYVRGDPMRHIHWPTTARHEGVYVKGFEPESRSVIWLFPDLDASSHRGVGMESTLEKQIILVASLADSLLRRHLSIGLFAYDDQPVIIEPRSGLTQLWKILKALSSLHATPDLQLADTIEHAVQAISPGHLLICVTPSLDTLWVEAWKSTGQARERGLYVVLLNDDSGDFRDVDQALNQLRRSGIQARVIYTSQIHPIEASYGVLRRWEFKTLPTGKTIVLQRPRMASSVFPARDK
jgi:uncharacterized protein (DUF58 family)